MKEEKTLFVQQIEAGKYGCVNSQGKVIIPFEYDYINNVSRDYEVLIVKKNGKYGVLNWDGKILLPLKYDSIIYEGILIVEKNEKFAVMNLDGEILLPFKYNRLYLYFEKYGEEYREFLMAEKNEKFGVIDLDGKTILPFEYDYMTVFYRNFKEEKAFLIVRKNNRYGIIDLDGKTIFPFEYSEIKICRESYSTNIAFLTVRKDSRYGIMDLNGKTILPFEYDYIDSERVNKFLIVRNNDKYGLINLDGEIILPLKYDDMTVHRDDLIVKQDEKYGIIDLDGKTILPFEYNNINDVYSVIEDFYAICKEIDDEMLSCYEEKQENKNNVVPFSIKNTEYEEEINKTKDILENIKTDIKDTMFSLATTGEWKEWSDTQPVGAIFTVTDEMLENTGDKNVDLLWELVYKINDVMDKLLDNIPLKKVKFTAEEEEGECPF